MALGDAEVADPLTPLEVGRALTESAKQAQDVLLVCYVGHGLVSPGGELYLATKSTERQPELLAYTALAYTAVRISLLQSPARSIEPRLPSACGRAPGAGRSRASGRCVPYPGSAAFQAEDARWFIGRDG